MKQKVIFTFTFVFIVLKSHGQGDALMNMAMEHFGKPEARSVWWLKDFKGYFDQNHAIRMVLATDNNAFKGAYEYLSSGEKFYLDGNYDGEQIVLVESDSLGRTTGIFKGDMNDEAFYAEWSDPKNIAAVPVFLTTESQTVNPCGNLGWAHHFAVKGQDSIKKISVWKYEEEINVQLFYPSTQMLLQMECLDDQCYQLNQNNADIDEESHWHIDLEKKIMVNIVDQRETLYNLKSTKSLYFDCASYMDFDDKFSMVYPISSSEKFNTWILANWAEKYGSSGKSIHKQQNNYSVSDRVSHEEYGNVHLDFFNDKMISGIFILQSSKYAEATELPFAYNFDREKEIAIAEIFLPGNDVAVLIEQMVAGLKNERGDGDEFARFQAKEYRLVSISWEGLVCRTPFSTIYGQDKVIVAKDKLKPYLKKNAVPIW
ncbi:MAG: hypothetical protein U0V54_06710 [Saprospiraceae bacterium]|nr:hypothetical protein [Saprospiraceae bacterium]